MQNVVCHFYVIVLVLLSNVAKPSAQSVVVDRTGSLVNQQVVESELQTVLPAAALVFRAIRLVFFHDLVLQAEAVTVRFELDVHSDFGNLQDAAKLRALKLAGPQIRSAFTSAIDSPAKVSNIPAAIKRTADDSVRGLLVTDGDNEAPAPRDIVTLKPIVVVLCSAKRDDPGQELAIYERRRQHIISWAPNAQVFPCFELRKAAIAWMSNDSMTLPARTAR